MIKPAPIIEAATDKAGLFSTIWTLWFQNLVNGINNIVSQSDIEIVGDTKGLILESPNGTRWRVQVSNAGALTITSL